MDILFKKPLGVVDDAALHNEHFGKNGKWMLAIIIFSILIKNCSIFPLCDIAVEALNV